MDNLFQQGVIDGIAEPIMLIGEDYVVKLMNRAAREFAAVNAGLSKPLYCYQVSHQRETPCEGVDHPCPIQLVRETGQPVTVVHEHYLAGEKRRIVEVVAAPYIGEDGTFQGIIESNRDITEKKRIEAALRKYTLQLRAMTAQLAEVEDAERLRLSRELHDQVGQNLSALSINLNIIRTQLPEQVDAQILNRLDDSVSLVEQTGETIRDIMADLRPPVLDDYGLVAALHWYGDQFFCRTGIEITIEGDDPDIRLDFSLENALFRIAQEALINVAKHAQASCVRVKVDTDNEMLRLDITDDGIGFDASRRIGPEDNQGWGLLTMSERAEAVGGQFRISSIPNQGTTVVVEVPS